jgi:hypothetical protein
MAGRVWRRPLAPIVLVVREGERVASGASRRRRNRQLRSRGPYGLSNLNGMYMPEVELLWWEGCPSTDRALDELKAALRDVGLGDADVRLREIHTDDEAVEAEFAGAPTILIDGADLLPHGSGDDAPIGLSCRVYRRRDGRVSPTPDPDDLREALRRAAARPEVKR